MGYPITFGTESDAQLAALSLECDIICEKAITDFIYSASIPTPYMEAEEAKHNKFVETVHKIVSSIVKMLGDCMDKIQEKVRGKSHVELEDYLKTQTGQIQVQYDLDQVHKRVNDDLREKSKLLDILSRVTGKDATDIQDRILKEPKTIQTESRMVISGATYLRWYDKYSKKGAITPFEDQLKRAEHVVSGIKDNDAQKAAVKVIYAMKNTIGEYITVVDGTFSQMKSARDYTPEDSKVAETLANIAK